MLLTPEGDLRAFENLANEYDSKVEVLVTDSWGRITTAPASSFEISGWDNTIIVATFTSGLRIAAHPEQRFSASEGEWIDAQSFAFGTVVRGVCYNSTHKGLTSCPDEVVHVRREVSDGKQPLYSCKLPLGVSLLTASSASSPSSDSPSAIPFLIAEVPHV